MCCSLYEPVPCIVAVFERSVCVWGEAFTYTPLTNVFVVLYGRDVGRARAANGARRQVGRQRKCRREKGEEEGGVPLGYT